MRFSERFRRHRKDARLIIGALGALMVVLVFSLYLMQRAEELPPALVTNRVLLFALWYVNVLLILAILFVLLRNLFKLFVERYNHILGAKLKTRLVLSFFGVSLIPVLLLFLISTQLLRGAIDRWFSTPIGELLPLGHAVSEGLSVRIEQENLRDARRALANLSGLRLAEPTDRVALNRRLRDQLSALELDYLALYEGTELVQGAINSASPLADLPEPGRALLREAAAEGSAHGQPPIEGDGVLIASAVSDVAASEAAGAREPLVLVAGRVLPPSLAIASRRLIEAAQSHRQLRVQREDFKASYLLIFLMVTLLILLASSWLGLYLARRITVPIQALADGTRRLSSGDLDTRVEVEADNELGVLVDSFNSMTAELKGNREQLEAGNRELTLSNERLARERALIGAVLANVAAGVMSVDRDGRIRTCNKAALAMLRQREEEVVGRLASEAWADPERARLAQILGEAPAPGQRLSREVQLLLGGRWNNFEVKLTALPEGDSEPGGWVLVLEDLTELIQAQQLAAWREAARRIAHEIKNPLTPIKLAAERVLAQFRKGDPDLGSKLEQGVGIIVREVGTLQDMVDEFSRYARMPPPRPAPVDLDGLCQETVHLYRNLKAGVTVSSQVEPGIGTVRLDAEQVKRALINLLDNALEATEAPGTVLVQASRRDGLVRISVADEGRGVPPEAKEKLFLPYFSTKGRGTGLGLAIVHRIVTDHHGTIRAEDNQPRGTVFTIELPA